MADQNDYEKAAEALSKTLGIEVLVGKDRHDNGPALVVNLTEGNPPVRMTQEQLRALWTKIVYDVKKGEQIRSGGLFDANDDGKLRFVGTEVPLQKVKEVTDGSKKRWEPTGETRTVPIAEFLESYKDELRTIIEMGSIEAKREAQAAAEKELAQTAIAEGYAKQMQDIVGMEVTTLAHKDSFLNREPKHFLVIDIGDAEPIDKASDKLIQLRDKAGLGMDALPFQFEDDYLFDFEGNGDRKSKGQILLSVKAIQAYEDEHGVGALFEKLAEVKDEFASVLKTAKEQADVITKMPSFVPEGDFNFLGVSSNNRTPSLVITGADFELPDNVRDTALAYAKELRKIIKQKTGLDNPAGTRELRATSELLGHEQPMDEEVAAYLLARSLSNPTYPHMQIEPIVSFDGVMNSGIYDGTDGKDPKVVFEAARLILAKTYGVAVPGSEEPHSFSEHYLNAVDKSLSTTRYRC